MAKQDFVPNKQADRISDGGEFVNELQVDGTNFGVSATEVTEAKDAFGDFEKNFKKGVEIDAKKQEQSKTTKTTDNVFVAIWRKLAKRMKGSQNYKEAVGERYKIVGDENSIDIDKAQPKLKARKVETGWEISFNLLGFFDGVKIFRKRPGEEKKFLAVDTSSPYIDTDAMVNGTQYTAWFLLGDDTEGLESDPGTIQI